MTSRSLNLSGRRYRTASPVARGATKSLFARLGAALAGLFDLLLLWQERSAQRIRLGQLDDRLLRDMGLDRDSVVREVRKPFWQA